MKKIIITTTINRPTEAIIKYANMSEWQLIIAGDLKTPHNEYNNINCTYLHPEEQEIKYKNISDIIGWNTIDRRNIAILEAYKLGADVIATVDDDNIPYDNWGKDLLVNKEIICDLYESENNVFDPLSVTEHNKLWHRGYPIEYIKNKNNVKYKGKTKRKVLIQADLWDGDPDIDAIARITYKPIIKFKNINPYCSNQISPFNSQNTFLSREVIPYYSCLPYTERMCDIWGSYILQYYFPNSVVYNRSSVYQERNIHDLTVDLENEMRGYKHNLNLLNNLDNFLSVLPDKTKMYWKYYRKYFDNK
jgi:hypothetical protein